MKASRKKKRLMDLPTEYIWELVLRRLTKVKSSLGPTGAHQTRRTRVKDIELDYHIKKYYEE